VKWLLPAAVLAGLVALAFWSIDAARAIAFGWAQFLVRVLPRLTWDRNAIILAAAAFALFTLGVHWLGRALVRWRGSESRWKPSWSAAVTSAVVVAFAAGICMIGVVHQTGWLMANPEPAMVESERVYGVGNYDASQVKLKVLALGLLNSLDANANSSNSDSEHTIANHSWVSSAIIYGGYSLSNAKGERIDMTLPWNDPKNQKFFRALIPVVINPSLPNAPLRDANGFGLAHYSANCLAMTFGAIRPLNQFTDGTGNTIMIGEVNTSFRPWGDPGNVRDPSRGINRSRFGFGGPPASGGALFGMADGSVRFVSENVSPSVLKALATPDGGEPIAPGVLREP
jgi:hypothetical protein